MRQTFHFAVAKGIDAAHEEPPNTNFSPSFQERPPFFTFPEAPRFEALRFSRDVSKRYDLSFVIEKRRASASGSLRE